MDEQLLQDFIVWLPTKFEEFKDKTPEQTVEILNNLSQSDEGKRQIETIWGAFMQETGQQGAAPQQQGMFRKGGKIDAFVEKYQGGGKKNPVKSANTLALEKEFKNYKESSRSTHPLDRGRGRVQIYNDLKESLKKDGFSPNSLEMAKLTGKQVVGTVKDVGKAVVGKKEGGSIKKRCQCGCEIIPVKENGGIVERCACGCRIKKKQDGGNVKLSKNNKSFGGGSVSKNSEGGIMNTDSLLLTIAKKPKTKKSLGKLPK